MKTRTRTHATSRALTKPLTLLLTATLALFAHASVNVCRAQSQAQTQPAARPADAGVAEREKGAREGSSGAITGRVVGEAGEPMPGALVYVGQRGGASQFSRTQQRVSTDDEGNFQLTGLDSGLYSVSADIPGYVSDTDFSNGRPPAYRPGDTVLLRLVKGGVITGTVTDTQGEAIVGLGVRAYRVRDLDGIPVTFGSYTSGVEDRTDDRGVYRIFGLMPGVYVVSAGTRNFYGYAAAYAGDVMTFYPSATRDTASEITVRAGQENAGVDIRFRDEQGRNITGRVEPPAGSQTAPDIRFYATLAYASTGIQADFAFVQPNALTFSFEGVADGDYDVQVIGGGREGQLSISVPQRVSVRGADVTRLKLTLAPLASVSGSLSVAQSPTDEGCRQQQQQKRPPVPPQETLVTLARDRPAATRTEPATRTSLLREATPDASGAFTMRGLEAGRYRLNVRPLDESLYVRSIKLPATATAAPARATPTPPTLDALEVRAGQQLSGVTVYLSEGAATLSGRVAVAEGSAPPNFSLTRVHLVPAERERADDLLGYFDATPDGSGAFNFKNVPPGRYLVVLRPAPEATPDAPPRPAHWDADSRARLRRDAEAANSTVELPPCGRTNDFVLRLPK